MKNILFSVENTDPKCYWLVGYLETLLVQVRKPQRLAYPVNQTVMLKSNWVFLELRFKFHN